MKAVVFYEIAEGVTVEMVMGVYPRHQRYLDGFAEGGRIIAIGPFANPGEGSMGIFRDKASAEEFVGQDPFVTEGLVGRVTIREWNESLLP